MLLPRDTIRPLLLVLLVASSAAPDAAPAPPAAKITGFRAVDAGAELEREAAMAAVPSADSLRRHLRILTESPSVAGTPGDRANAEYVRRRLEAYG